MTVRSGAETPTGWVVVAMVDRHPRYFIAAIDNSEKALAGVRRLLGDRKGVLKLGSRLNAAQLAARAMEAGDIYQLGKAQDRVRFQYKAAARRAS